MLQLGSRGQGEVSRKGGDETVSQGLPCHALYKQS